MDDRSFSKGLTDILVKIGAIPQKEQGAIEESFARSSKSAFDDFLLSEGIVSRKDLLKALSLYYEMPAVDLEGLFFDTFYLKKFPKDFLIRNALIPRPRDENILVMIAARPNDPDLLSQIGQFVSYDVRFQVGIRQDIMDAVQEYYDDSYTEGIEQFLDQEKNDEREKEVEEAEKENW